MYRHAALLAAIAMGATGCAGTVGEVQDRVEPVVEAGIAEIKARKDQQFRRWRKLREWADAYACILSKGAIERNATPEERETIDNTRCAP